MSPSPLSNPLPFFPTPLDTTGARQTEVPEPPELSLLHEELGASCASVAQEFPQNIVPPERVMDASNGAQVVG